MSEIFLDFENPIVELKKKIGELQQYSEQNNIDVSAELAALEARVRQTREEIYSHLTPWQRVQLARHPERPYTLDYINRIFTDYIELAGDRRFRDDKAVVGGFAKLNVADDKTLDRTGTGCIAIQPLQYCEGSSFNFFDCLCLETIRKQLLFV